MDRARNEEGTLRGWLRAMREGRKSRPLYLEGRRQREREKRVGSRGSTCATGEDEGAETIDDRRQKKSGSFLFPSWQPSSPSSLVAGVLPPFFRKYISYYIRTYKTRFDITLNKPCAITQTIARGCCTLYTVFHSTLHKFTELFEI